MKVEKQRRTPSRKASRPAPPAWPEKREASQAQKDEAAAARERKTTRRAPVPVSARMPKGGALQIGGTLTDEAVHYERLLDVCGTRSADWMNGLVGGLVNVGGGFAEGDASAQTLLEGIAFLNGVAPRDEVEAALGSQMFAVHRACMTLARRMAGSELRDQYRDYGNLLVKTTRTYAAQVEALAKLRSGGKQQVEVRYVYVDARGSQNVIGSEIVAGGGRCDHGNGHQSHTPVPGLPFAPGVPVWGADPQGHAVPGAGGPASPKMQDAWRDQSRSTEGAEEREIQGRPADGGDDRGAPDDPGARTNRAGDAK
jgi:hypothetical protein